MARHAATASGTKPSSAGATRRAAAGAAGKGAPACAAIAFRGLASGMADGEQEAGSYRSRFAKLALRATVKQGEASDYHVVANGNRLGAAPAALPPSAESCAAAKKMPAPRGPAASCTGQRFRLVIHHAGEQRLGLLYAEEGGNWRFCGAGTF